MSKIWVFIEFKFLYSIYSLFVYFIVLLYISCELKCLFGFVLYGYGNFAETPLCCSLLVDGVTYTRASVCVYSH